MIIPDNSKSFVRIYKRYTLWFCLYAILCICLFSIIYGKSFITFDDGLHEQYVYFVYTGIWIRRLFSNLFIDHVFEIPMWDMSIGMGADPVATFCVGADPLIWVSAILPKGIYEIAFNCIIVIKLYLAGLSYCFYCRERFSDVNCIVIGALVYVFSATTSVGMRQGAFLALFYLFPLLMLGCERLWVGRGHKLYVIVLAICVIQSFYFTYMFGILIIVYCIIRFLTEGDNRNVKKLLALLARFTGYTILGIGAGIGWILPSMIYISNMDRLKEKISLNVIDPSIIRNQFLYAFSYCNFWHESIWGFSSIALIALILLFKSRKSLRLKIMVIIYTISFAFPLIGSVMNGFNYPANRYIFGYAFLLAYIVTYTYGSFNDFRGKVFAYTAAVSALYLVITLFNGKCSILSGLSLVISVLMIGGSNHMISSEKIRSHIIMLCALITCFMIGVARSEETMPQFIDFGSANDSIYRFEDDLDVYNVTKSRYDVLPYSYTDVPINSSMLLGANGYDFYHSNYNNFIDHYYDDLAIVSNAMGYQQTGLRGRSFLEIMNGTEYILRQNDETRVIRAPYLYERDLSNDNYDIYRLSDDSSLVFFYDNVVPYETYRSMSPCEREELMMNFCVADVTTDVDQGSYVAEHTVITPDRVEVKGCEYTQDTIIVPEESGYISYDVPEIVGQEISVYVDRLDHQGEYYYQFAVVLMHGEEAVAADFYAGIDQGFVYYHGKNCLLFNFGVIDEEVDEIRLYFNTSGEYKLNRVDIYTRTTDQLKAVTDAFYEHADIDDISYEYSGNHISINAVADKEKYLYLAVPYSDGWSATVDGELAEIVRANEAFMAIKIAPGVHNIELRYTTPYLKTGVAVTLISIGVLCIFEISSAKKSKNKDKSIDG